MLQDRRLCRCPTANRWKKNKRLSNRGGGRRNKVDECTIKWPRWVVGQQRNRRQNAANYRRSERTKVRSEDERCWWQAGRKRYDPFIGMYRRWKELISSFNRSWSLVVTVYMQKIWCCKGRSIDSWRKEGVQKGFGRCWLSIKRITQESSRSSRSCNNKKKKKKGDATDNFRLLVNNVWNSCV